MLLISSSILSSCQDHVQFLPFTVGVLPKLYHSYSFLPCRLKDINKCLTDQKEYESTPVEKRNKELHVNLGVCKAMKDENNGREVHPSTPVETRCTRNDNDQLR